MAPEVIHRAPDVPAESTTHAVRWVFYGVNELKVDAKGRIHVPGRYSNILPTWTPVYLVFWMKQIHIQISKPSKKDAVYERDEVDEAWRILLWVSIQHLFEFWAKTTVYMVWRGNHFIICGKEQLDILLEKSEGTYARKAEHDKVQTTVSSLLEDDSKK